MNRTEEFQITDSNSHVEIVCLLLTVCLPPYGGIIESKGFRDSLTTALDLYSETNEGGTSTVGVLKFDCLQLPY